MEPLQRVKLGDQYRWLVEGHTLSEGAIFEVFYDGQWQKVKHVKGSLLNPENDQLFFEGVLEGKLARLVDKARQS